MAIIKKESYPNCKTVEVLWCCEAVLPSKTLDTLLGYLVSWTLWNTKTFKSESVWKLKLGHHWTFHQDHDLKLVSKSTQKWLTEHKNKLLKWTSQSPELNPTETLWEESTRAGLEPCMIWRGYGKRNQLQNQSLGLWGTPGLEDYRKELLNLWPAAGFLSYCIWAAHYEHPGCWKNSLTRVQMRVCFLFTACKQKSPALMGTM